MKRIVVTGSLGQLGSELAPALRARCGVDNVVVTDVRGDAKGELVEGGPFYQLDSRDGKRLAEIVRAHRADTIYHLAALLSATSEAKPQRAWEINMDGLVSVLEVAREQRLRGLLPELDRGLRAAVAQGLHAAGHDPAADHDVRRSPRSPASCSATTTTSASASTCAGCASPASSRTSRRPAAAPPTTPCTSSTPRSRHGRYTCFLGRRHEPRHDVHAGRDQRRHRADGGRPRAPAAPQRLQHRRR